MDKSTLLLQYSAWYIFLCLIIGGIYAFALYQKEAPWSKRINITLALGRFILVSLICFLFLAPTVRYIKNTSEKPTIVFAIDDSQSLAIAQDSNQLKATLKILENIAQKLSQKDIQVAIQTFNAKKINQLPDIKFLHPSSNLSQLLKTIQNNYENRNLDKVILVSDGIYNQGNSPLYNSYNFPIVTVGLGDTTQKQDLKITNLLFNKISYVGNKFPIVAEIQNIRYANQTTEVLLKQNGKILERKTLALKKDGDINEVTFQIVAQQKGIQHYTVEVTPLEGEITLKNNIRDAYIEVIDGKEKILLLALTPHPDIKALRSAIEKNENYSLELCVLGLSQPKEAKYDLVIFHQVPDISGLGRDFTTKFQNTPQWHILGNQSGINWLNTQPTLLKIVNRFGRIDKVTPIFNTKFDKFIFEESKIKILEKLPPLSVPFGDYNVINNAEVILYQKVGNVPTNKPILLLGNYRDVKTAILTGEGIWQWRQEEYNLTEKNEVVDELITKIVQYLSTKEDKRKLRVYPIQTEFFDFEKVSFEAETYNNIYERIYNQKISLQLTNLDGKSFNYSFTTTEGSSRFDISGLTKGNYHYKATAEIGGKLESVEGEFAIKDLQLEALNTTADHNFLTQLATQTGGKFYTANQLADLEKDILANRKANILHSQEDLLEIIHLKWIFFLLLILVSSEWIARKYYGRY